MSELDPVASWHSYWTSLSPARAFRFLFVAFLALHVWKVARLLPIQHLGDGAPLVEYHYSQIYVDVVHDRAFRHDGRSWGYDPFTGGGQLVGAGLVPESHAVIVFDRLLRFFFRPDTTIKLFTGLALLAGPLLLFAAARLFGLGAPVSLAAAALFSAGMISHDNVSRMLIYRGHITFWLSGTAALFNAAVLYAWTRRPARAFAAAFLVSAPLIPLLDPAVALVQIAPVVYIVLMVPDRRAQKAALLGGAFALAVALNAFWLRPYLMFRGGLTDYAEWPSRGLDALGQLFLPVQGDFLERIQAATRASLFLMAIGGFVSLLRDRRPLATLLGVWTLALGAVALYGSHLPLFNVMEPERLSFAVTTLLLLPGGVYVMENVMIPGSRRILFAGWFLWLMMTWQLVHPYEGYPLRNELTPREERLLADLRELPPAGRVLVQYHPLFTDGLRLASVEHRHAFIGFAGSWWKTRAGSDASFNLWQNQWYLFNEPLTGLKPEKLDEFLRAYNIAYIITTAPAGHAYFSYYQEFEELPSRGEGAYRIFRVTTARPGYLLKGGGHLTFDYDRLSIHGVGAGAVELSFHHANGFRTTPPLAVHAAKNAGNAPPLLVIDNPFGRQDIEVRYEGR